MTEAEQLQILERIPGFVRPSAEWLKGLEVSDRVMIYILEGNGSVEWGSAIVEDKCHHSFDLRYRDALYAVSRSGNLTTEGGGQDRILTYWISPIEPEPPQQETPAEAKAQRFFLGDVVRMAFTDERLEPDQFIEARISAIVGWASQTNYHLDLPSSFLYTIEEEETQFSSDDGHLIRCYDGSFQFYTADLEGAFCNAEVVK